MYFSETVESWQDWGRIYQSIPAFEPLVKEIFRRESLPWEPLSPLTPGTNGVFRCGNLVVKVFFPKEAGENPALDFSTETAACRQALAWGVPCPDLVAQGTIQDRYIFYYLITSYLPGKEAGAWLETASSSERARFVGTLKTILGNLHRPAEGLFPPADLKAQALENPRLKKLPPSLREEILMRVKNMDLGQLVLTHGDVTGENIVVRENGALAFLDWADARLAPPWYELGPLAFELLQGKPSLWRLFAGANRHVFLSGLLNCLCLHPFGPDFLEKMAAQTGRGMFCSLHDVKQTLLERMM